MNEPRPARGVAMAGAALMVVGASILVFAVEQDQIAALVAGLPEGFVVVGIIILTLGGAGLAAFIAREKPRPPAEPMLRHRNHHQSPGSVAASAEIPSRTVSPARESSPLHPSTRRILTLRPIIVACRAFARRAGKLLVRGVTPLQHGARQTMFRGQDSHRIRRARTAALRWARTAGVRSLAVARSVAKGQWGIPLGEAPLDWRQTAKQVHTELGGDLPVLLRTAERIESRYHHQFERVARDLRRASGIARRRVRYAAWGLSAVVPGTLAARLLIDEGYLERLAGTGITPELAGAALLTLGGTWWLHRLWRHSFSPLPFTVRKHKRETVLVSGLANLLDRAAIYAAAGLGVEDALIRAMMADQDASGARLLPLLSSSDPSDLLSLQERKSPLARCALTLVRRLEDGAAPSDALALTAAGLRIEHEWTRWHRVKKLQLALAFPLLTCVLPAAVLLLLH